jgi:ATP-dependent DNA ligase
VGFYSNTVVSAVFCITPLAAEGAIVFAKACELGLEGIVSKRAGSFYRCGGGAGTG